jgi:hypothetical protein
MDRMKSTPLFPRIPLSSYISQFRMTGEVLAQDGEPLFKFLYGHRVQVVRLQEELWRRLFLNPKPSSRIHFALLSLFVVSRRHHAMIPFRTKKCERHPVVRQTDGDSVGRPSQPTRNFHEGESVSIRLSWIVAPQPQGHAIAANHGFLCSPTAYRANASSVSGSSSTNTAR